MLAYVKKYHIHLTAFSNKIGKGEKRQILHPIYQTFNLFKCCCFLNLKGISSFF